MTTIKDVAKAAGVSTATVSYVLNGREGLVSDATYRRVLEVAQQLGYRPNIVAQNLQSSSTKLLGYAWHPSRKNEPNLVMDEFLFHLTYAADRAGYRMLTFTLPSENPLAVYDELIQAGRVDAFILASTEYDDPRIEFLINQHFPFISFGRANPQWNFNWIDTDGRAGTRLATEYLIELGHRRIAFLGWPRGSQTGDDRLQGYLDTMAIAGLPPIEEMSIETEHAYKSVERTFERWDKLPIGKHPTAILAVSDDIAVATLHVARQYGFVVGQSLSVVGFDDAPYLRHIRPSLTTLRQPLDEIGTRLLQRVQSIISDQEQPTVHDLMQPHLIIRNSVARPR
jgi:DNA-binding LacI/PurR family transcriptional regulator